VDQGSVIRQPTRATSSAAVALIGSAHVRNVRLRARRGAALAAVANALVDQVTNLRLPVDCADVRGDESSLSINRQAVARVVDGDVKYERFAHYLEAVQLKEEAAPTRLDAQGILGRRPHADRGPLAHKS